MTNKRNSGIELLRIISMLIIITHHYVVNSGVIDCITEKTILNTKDYIILILGWGGKTAINCFLLITGYYMCEAKASAKKWLKLLGEIEFYSITIYIILAIIGYESISLAGVFRVVFPFGTVANGFSSCYLLFYAFIPFLNRLLSNLQKKEHLALIILCLLIYTILPSLAITVIIFNYITWFCIVYIIGAYIRKYPLEWCSSRFKMAILMSGSLLLSWGSVVGFSVYGSGRGCYFWVSDSNQILAVATAICTFLFFRCITEFYNKTINKIAASTFGVLMIHANSDAMRQWLWKDKLNNVGAYMLPFPYWLLHIIGSVALVYIACTVIDQIRILLFNAMKGLFKRKRRIL